MQPLGQRRPRLSASPIARWCSIATRRASRRRPGTFRRRRSPSPAAPASTSWPRALRGCAAERDAIRARARRDAATAAGRAARRSSSEIRQRAAGARRGRAAARARCALVIKTHPAETPEVYADGRQGATQRRVAGASTRISARLLAAADALVTMNSTVAIDALVAGRARARHRAAEQPQPVRRGGRHGRRRRRRRRFGGRCEALLYDREARQRARAARPPTSPTGSACDRRTAPPNGPPTRSWRWRAWT